MQNGYEARYLVSLDSKSWLDIRQRRGVLILLNKNNSFNENCTYCAQVLNTRGEFKEDGDKTVGELVASAVHGCAGCAILALGILEQLWIEFGQFDASCYIRFHRSSHLNDLLTACVYSNDDLDAEKDVHIEYYSILDKPSPWPGIPSARHLPEYALSISRSKLAREWISECLEGHSACRGTRSAELPSRILDVSRTSSIQQRPEPFLFVPGKPVQGRYMALSYRWGKAVHIRTTTANIHRHQTCVSWSLLPKTFQDAINFTRALDVQYLWIDSLCIVQDDSHDWEIESAKMASIYGNSFATIAATYASDPAVGLTFSPDQQRKTASLCVSAAPSQYYARRARHRFGDCNMSHEGGIPSGRSWHTEDEDRRCVPLLQRGWTFQEHILSPRVIQFGPHEMIFECNTTQRCECRLRYPALCRHEKRLLQTSLSDSHTTIQSTVKIWHKIVREYTRRHLTQVQDTLPAISGVAHLIRSLTGSAYYAGIWQHSVIDDLRWVTATRWPAARPMLYQAPSWSWAAAYNLISYGNSIGTDIHEFRAIVLDIQCVTSTQDPLGKVSSGFISIDAWHFDATIDYKAVVEFAEESYRGIIKHPHLKRTGLFMDIPCDDRAECHVPQGSPIKCLIISAEMYAGNFRPFVMIVIPSNSVPGAFERIGGGNDQVISDTFFSLDDPPPKQEITGSFVRQNCQRGIFRLI